MTNMPKSSSGRVVAEIDPELKAALYSVLALERRTLTQWLTQQAHEYVRGARKLAEKPRGSGS